MQPNDGLQLRRAITIQTEGTKLLEKHAIAPSAARLCWIAFDVSDLLWLSTLRFIGTARFATWPFTQPS